MAEEQSYFKTVKKALKTYQKINGRPPSVVRMTQEFYDNLKKEIKETWPLVKYPKFGHETIFGVPIEIVDKKED